MRLLPAVLLLAIGLPAQIPDGSVVVSSMSSVSAGRGGLFVVDPRVPEASVPITGLPEGLLGDGGIEATGANAVAIRHEDGRLLVGEIGSDGAAIHLHELELNGAHVVADRTFAVGTVRTPYGQNGGIHQIAVLPSGDAVVAVSGLMPAPAVDEMLLAIVRQNGQVVPIPVSGVRGTVCNALAVDDPNATIYFAVLASTSIDATIYAAPYPAGGAARVLATVPLCTGLAIDGRGRLLCSADAQSGIYTIDVASGTSRLVAGTRSLTNSLVVERATDAVFYVRNLYELGYIDRSGAVRPLNWRLSGVLTGVAVNDVPRTYGRPSSSRFRWRVWPSVGGLPRLGNARFAVQVDIAGESSAGVLLISIARASMPMLGLELLIDPNSVIGQRAVADGGLVTLPISTDEVVGTTLFLQSFHLDPAAPQGVSATEGLRVTFLR